MTVGTYSLSFTHFGSKSKGNRFLRVLLVIIKEHFTRHLNSVNFVFIFNEVLNVVPFNICRKSFDEFVHKALLCPVQLINEGYAHLVVEETREGRVIGDLGLGELQQVPGLFPQHGEHNAGVSPGPTGATGATALSDRNPDILLLEKRKLVFQSVLLDSYLCSGSHRLSHYDTPYHAHSLVLDHSTLDLLLHEDHDVVPDLLSSG